MKTPATTDAMTSALDSANGITKPAIYLAGKIDKNDFRNAVIPGLRDRRWEQGPILTPTFRYLGPFFVSCDHGCVHAPNQHGAILTSREDTCGEPGLTRREVIDRNMSAVAAADLVVAYITATDCHGTLFEIGYALALGKPVVMVFAPNIDAADFWFLSMQCAAVYESVDLCRLSEILAAEIRKTIRRRRTT